MRCVVLNEGLATRNETEAPSDPISEPDNAKFERQSTTTDKAVTNQDGAVDAASDAEDESNVVRHLITEQTGAADTSTDALGIFDDMFNGTHEVDDQVCPSVHRDDDTDKSQDFPMTDEHRSTTSFISIRRRRLESSTAATHCKREDYTTKTGTPAGAKLHRYGSITIMEMTDKKDVLNMLGARSCIRPATIKTASSQDWTLGSQIGYNERTYRVAQ